MVDLIIIRDLEVACRVGVSAAERAHSQRLAITVEIERDLRAAARGDEIADTVDYDRLARRIRAEAEEGECRLLETLAERLASVVLAEPEVRAVTVEARKFALPRTAWVGVRIQRERGGSGGERHAD